MSRYTLSPSAKADILEIRQYTTEQWGERQTEKYTLQLQTRMKWLSDNPKLGMERSDLQKGMYTYPQGSHFIVYRESAKGIEIARVLHQSMDYENHLTQEIIPAPVSNDESH